MSTLVNEMKIYPVEFFRQAPALGTNRVSMLPCKFNMGAVTFADRIDYTWNGAFANTNYWTAAGATFRVNAGQGGVFGRQAGQLTVTSSQATLTNNVITLPSAIATNASVYVTCAEQVNVAINILGTNNTGATVNDTATSGFITIQPNTTTRINVVSNYVGTTFRRLQFVVGDGVTSESGKEVYFSQAQITTGNRIGIDMPDETSDSQNPAGPYNVTAASLTSNVATLTMNSTSGIGVGGTIQIAGLTGGAAILNGVHRVLTVPSGTSLTFVKIADNFSNITGLVGTLMYGNGPGIPKGQITYDLTLGAGSSIPMDTPLSGTFYTTVGTGGQDAATLSTIFAITGAGGAKVALDYSKNTQTLSFSTPGGSIASAPPAQVNVKTIVSAELSSNIATFTTSVAHGFIAGATVTVAGLQSVYNGTYTILDTPTPTTFRYNKINENVALETGLNGTATYNGVNLVPGDKLWVGWTIARDNIVFKYTVNGSPVSTSQTGSNTSPTSTFTRLNLGHDELVQNHWEGAIEQFLIYDVAISSSELDTMAAKTTPTNMVDDSRIAFAAITADHENQYWISYQRAKDLTYRWDGTWRNADIRARISNNSSHTGKAFNTVDMVAIQKDTDWFRSGGSSSWPQSRVWVTAFVDTENSSTFYYAPFYCTNPDYPDWSLWETFDLIDIPGNKTTVIVNPRWSQGSDERDFYYMPELTNLRPYPNDQRSYGYVQ